MKKKSTLLLIAIAVFFCTLEIKSQDGFLTHVSPQQKYLKTATNYTISAWVQNNSGINIASFKVGWKLDNGAATLSSTINISGGLPNGGYYEPYSFTAPMNVSTVGTHTLYVWVDAAGDINHSNDTVKVNFTTISSYSSKNVLFELLTATWCPNCPQGDAAAESIAALPYAAVAEFHSSDALSCTDGETYYYTYFPGGTIYTPSGIIDMSEFGGYAVNSATTSWVNDMDIRADEISPMGLNMVPALDTNARTLNVDLTANFMTAENGDYYMNLYILENGIVAAQDGASSTFVHDNVVRAMLGGPTGTSGIIPATPIAGTNYTKTYAETIPAAWNISRISLVGLVFRNDSAYNGIVNCIKFTYDHTGINSYSLKSNAISIYPNPCNSEFTCVIPDEGKTATLSIYSCDGKLVYSNEYKVADKNAYVNIGEYSSGLYNVVLRTENNIYSSKIIKN